MRSQYPVRMHYVYALTDPRTGVIRYVGKCKASPVTRLNNHLHEAAKNSRHNHRLAWLRELVALDFRPGLVELARFDSDAAAIVAECCWIGRLRQAGVPLVNATDGGEGMPNPSEATRAKLRQRPQVGWSAEARRAGREANRRKWADPEYRAAHLTTPPPLTPEELRAVRVGLAKHMGALNKGRIKTPEHRAKLAESLRQAHAEGRAASRKGAKHTEETKAKLRAAWARRKGVVPQ